MAKLMTYSQLAEIFENRRQIIRNNDDLQDLITLCENIFPKMLYLSNKFGENLIINKQSPIEGLDAAISADYTNQIHSLIASYELLLKSLVSSSNAIIRIIIETLVKDMFLIYKKDPELENIYLRGSFMGLNETEEAYHISKKIKENRLSFNNCRQELFERKKNDSLRKTYEKFSEFSHGTFAGLNHNIEINISEIKDKLQMITQLSFWIIIMFLKYFDGYLPIDLLVQSEIYEDFDKSFYSMGVIVDLLPNHKNLNITDSFESLCTFFNYSP